MHVWYWHTWSCLGLTIGCEYMFWSLEFGFMVSATLSFWFVLKPGGYNQRWTRIGVWIECPPTTAHLLVSHQPMVINFLFCNSKLDQIEINRYQGLFNEFSSSDSDQPIISFYYFVNVFASLWITRQPLQPFLSVFAKQTTTCRFMELPRWPPFWHRTLRPYL